MNNLHTHGGGSLCFSSHEHPEGRFTTGQAVIADGAPAEIVGYWRNGAWTCRELEHGTTWAVDADRIMPVDE